MTPFQFAESVSSRDFTEIIAAENQGPPRWVRMVCWQLAILIARVFNATKSKDAPTSKAEDFIPWKETKPEQSIEDMIMVCEALSMQTFGDEGSR